MKKYIFLILMSSSAFGQNINTILGPMGVRTFPTFRKKAVADTNIVRETKTDFKDRLHYGGNIWLGFWGAFYIDASPMVGYEVGTKGTIVGLGSSIIYQGGYNQSSAFAYGIRAFVRQPVYRSIFLHGEYEFMNADSYRFYDDPSYSSSTNTSTAIGRKWGGSPLVGVGLYTGQGGQQRGSFISVMYNLGAPSFGFISPQGLGGFRSPIVLRYGFFF